MVASCLIDVFTQCLSIEIGQYFYMSNYATVQGRQSVTAFQATDDPPLRMLCGDVHHLPCQPGIIGLEQPHLRHIVFSMCIESG